jgi:hypothetical protein
MIDLDAKVRSLVENGASRRGINARTRHHRDCRREAGKAILAGAKNPAASNAGRKGDCGKGRTASFLLTSWHTGVRRYQRRPAAL